MGEVDKFVAWVNGANNPFGDGPLFYTLNGGKEFGNPVYWAYKAGTKPGKFTKDHAFKVMGCAKGPTPDTKDGKASA